MTEKVIEAWGVFNPNVPPNEGLLTTPGRLVTGPLFCIYEQQEDAVEDFGGFSSYMVRPIKIIVPDGEKE